MNSPILIRPYITEKTMQLAQTNWFSFVVALYANKAQIAGEVAKMYKVNVVNVRTSVVTGKMKRTGKRQRPIQKPTWKKAMVQLKAGQTIDAFQIQEQEKK
ncbi:MAG: 50S ribosomal protein L23 [uncultured bacterium]|nr:MAG: 50S ribosomal protein L23 [uncultured bacterium]